MVFPNFRDDDEMAAWFEKNDVSAADLEVADDVAFAPDVTVTLAVEVYSLQQPTSRTANFAATEAGDRSQFLTPVKA